jgi:hypothetical protein
LGKGAPDHQHAPQAGFASAEEAILPAVSILQVETCGGGDIAEELCDFLCRAALWDALRSSVGEAGAIEAAVAALRAHPHRAFLQCQALFLICNLNTNPIFFEYNEAQPHTPWSRPSIAAGALELAAAALRRHPDDAQVQGAATGVIHNLCGDGFAAGSRAMKLGAVPLIEAAVRNHQQDDFLEQWAPLAIRNVQRADACTIPLSERRSRFAVGLCFDGHSVEPEVMVQDIYPDCGKVICDVCAKTIPWGTEIWRCDQCEFDVCLECCPMVASDPDTP